MILADTSVWVDHLRCANTRMVSLLAEGEIAGHQFVIGEIALGHLKHRQEILGLLSDLPQATLADHDEVLRFVEQRELATSGLGWVDVHLLAAAALDRCGLWTLDRRLAAVASSLGLGDRAGA
ncbi:MAG TPA: type II toxin-antitoxin system VapC family toxin [Thermoanaerobaculia bacterium]|nr:type II toxin-antitoxin system VapC family toxin [Thermoanaerobaculia bacterium]